MSMIRFSVGRMAQNLSDDVLVIKRLLNANLRFPYRPVAENGSPDSQTIALIEDFQKRTMGWPNPTGMIVPNDATHNTLILGANLVATTGHGLPLSQAPPAAPTPGPAPQPAHGSGHRYDLVRTQATPKEMFAAYHDTWVTLYGKAGTPSKESVCVLVAHWGIETGGGGSTWNWNVGNIKSYKPSQQDHCFMKCFEYYKPQVAARVVAGSTPTARVELGTPQNTDLKKYALKRSDGAVLVWFYPDHPVAAFLAFPHLIAGVTFKMKLVHNNYPAAWDAAIAASPSAYATGLWKNGKNGYFTAGLDVYIRGMEQYFAKYTKSL